MSTRNLGIREESATPGSSPTALEFGQISLNPFASAFF